MQAGITSLRADVERLKDQSTARARRRETRRTTATTTATAELSVEMLNELAILRADIEELLLQQQHPHASSHIEQGSGRSTYLPQGSRGSSRFLSVDSTW